LLGFLIVLAVVITVTPPVVAHVMANYQYNEHLLSQSSFIDPQRTIFCRVLFYVATAAVGAVFWTTLLLVRHIRNPLDVPLSIRTLALSSCAGNLLAIWTLNWI
jgi:hypothetical protein